MSARALISGRIWKDPERRVSSAGKAFGSASVRVGNGTDKTWWKLLSFSEAVTEELLAFHDGDAISAAGEFKAELYDGRDGPRVGFTIFADNVLSVKRPKKEKTKPLAEQPEASGGAEPSLNDEIPF